MSITNWAIASQPQSQLRPAVTRPGRGRAAPSPGTAEPGAEPARIAVTPTTVGIPAPPGDGVITRARPGDSPPPIGRSAAMSRRAAVTSLDPMTATTRTIADPATSTTTTSTAPVPPRHHRALVARCSAWCAAHRWRTLFAAILILAGAVVLLGGGFRTTQPVDQLVGDSAKATRITEGTDFGTHPTENVVVTARTGRLDPSTVRQLRTELPAAYRGLTGVGSVESPALSPDGTTMVLPLA